MHLQAKKLRGYSIAALDGELGSVKDLYFDDEYWGVRYFVVDTGSWLKGHKVLISTQSIRPDAVALTEQMIPVELSRKQVETAPPVDTEEPVSRHYERAHAAHYRNDYYWNGPHSWAAGPFGTVLSTAQPRPGKEGRQLEEISELEKETGARSHLRSSAEVIGYDVVATDGVLGRIDDLVIDSELWRITHLIVDTTKWLPGGQVVVPPEAVDRVDWATSSVHLNMTRDQIKNSPRPG